MSEGKVSVHVNSSWLAANHSLQDAVTLTPLADAKREEDGSLTDMVELDSCVLLSSPVEENGNQDYLPEPCTVSFKLEAAPNIVITNIVVVCEARVIEVHGAYNEYLMTVPADLLDEVDDTAVYSADIKVTQSTQECSLKFARLTRSSDMWIYGIKVLWKSDTDCRKKKNKTSHLNFETVEQRLEDLHTPLSGRAESCKQFLKMYSSLNKPPQPLPDAISLLSFLPALKAAGSTSTGSFLESLSQGYPSSPSTANSTSVNSNGLPKTEPDSLSCSNCCHKSNSVLEDKLKAMETRLMKALDDKVAALQQHQDNQFQNLFNLLAGNKAPVRLKDQENVSDTKIDQAINNLFFKGNKVSGTSSASIQDNTQDTNAFRNAFMTLGINEIFAGATHQSGIDVNGPTTISNSS